MTNLGITLYDKNKKSKINEVVKSVNYGKRLP